MKGSVRCAKRGCGRERKSRICPHCGYPSCYVSVFWRGQHWNFYTGKNGKTLVDFEEAYAVLSAMRLSINDGSFNPQDWQKATAFDRKFRKKANEWLQEKLDEAEAGEFSFSTLTSYKGYVKNYFLPFFDGWNVGEIRDDQLEEFKATLRKVPGIKTRRNILNALHAFFTWLKRRKVIQFIPQWPEGFKGDNAKVRRAIDRETQRSAMDRISKNHLDVIEMYTETGIRSGELCALKVKDLDELFGRLLIQRKWCGPRLIETTKTNKKRYLPLSQRALSIAVRNARGKLPDAFLFINSDTGNAYRQKKINELCKSTGLGLVAHEFGRHSFITQLIQTPGVTIKDAQELAGHADVHTTLKYSHTDFARLKEITERRGQIVSIAKRIQNGNGEQ